MHQKQVIIHAGDEGLAETGRVLYIEPDWTTDDLLQAAGRRLDLASTPKRMFNCNGEVFVVHNVDAVTAVQLRQTYLPLEETFFWRHVLPCSTISSGISKGKGRIVSLRTVAYCALTAICTRYRCVLCKSIGTSNSVCCPVAPSYSSIVFILIGRNAEKITCLRRAAIVGGALRRDRFPAHHLRRVYRVGAETPIG